MILTPEPSMTTVQLVLVIYLSIAALIFIGLCGRVLLGSFVDPEFSKTWGRMGPFEHTAAFLLSSLMLACLALCWPVFLVAKIVR
jgi:hypothetical protein